MSAHRGEPNRGEPNRGEIPDKAPAKKKPLVAVRSWIADGCLHVMTGDGELAIRFKAEQLEQLSGQINELLKRQEGGESPGEP